MPVRSVFFGTPEIAVGALEALASITRIVAVVCQPDRASGRGLKLTAPAVKVAASKLGVVVHQPVKIRRPPLAEWLEKLQVDVAVVMAYGRILPQAVLDAPRFGCVNLHASLLPQLRGAAPINWAIARGFATTGITLMRMEAQMDTGPILAQRELAIEPDETAAQLASRLAGLAAQVVREDLPKYLAGELMATVQDHDKATYAPMLTKQHGRIDWSMRARDIHNHVRAMTPWPGAFTTLRGQVLKVHRCVPDDSACSRPPGTVVQADRFAVRVACGGGTVELALVQLAGKKPVSATAMVAGRSIWVGDVLGL